MTKLSPTGTSGTPTLWLVFFILMAAPGAGIISAQEGDDRLEQGDFAVGLTGGYAAAHLYGSSRSGLKDFAESFDSSGGDDGVYQGSFDFTHSPRAGFYAEYAINDRLAVRSGLTYQRRGYTLNVEGIERDPDYQLDYNYYYLEKFRISTIDVPITAVWGTEKSWLFTAGVFFQISLKGTAKTTHENRLDATVNGMANEELSTPTITREVKVGETISSPVGFQAGIHKMISEKLALSLELQLGTPYSAFSLGKVADLGASLTLSHPLKIFN